MEEISRDTIRKIAENFRSREARRTADMEAARRDALCEASMLALDFVQLDPGITRVVLFGSLAREELLSPDFDIDLAVECTPGAFLQIVASALNSRFRVDVIDLKTAERRIRKSIEQNCTVLYEKQ